MATTGLIICLLYPISQRVEASELNFIDIWGEEEHACGLTSDAELVCWGTAAPVVPHIPENFKSSSKIIAVESGWACLSDDSFDVNCWGSGKKPERIKFLSEKRNALQVVSTIGSACVQLLDRTIQCWQGWSHSQFDDLNVDTPPTGAFLEGTLAGDGRTYCALSLKREVTCWGQNAYLPEDEWIVKLEGQYSSLAMNWVENCGLQVSGELSCLGNSSQTPYSPVEYGDIAKLFAGELMGCAIDKSGNLHCWGGQRANHNIEVPDDIGPSSKVVFLERGMCSLGVDGSVRCWGKPSQLIAGPIRVAGAPQMLRVTELGSTGLDVSWQKPETESQTVERYELFIRKSGSTWRRLLANVSAGTEFSITKLQSSTRYEIFVKAKYLAGYSAPSENLRILTLGHCPESLLAKGRNLASILKDQKKSLTVTSKYLKIARHDLNAIISKHSGGPLFKKNSPFVRLLASRINYYDFMIYKGLAFGDISAAARYTQLRDDTQSKLNTILGRVSVYTLPDVIDASNYVESAMTRLGEVATKITATSKAISSLEAKCSNY
jgi:hypothetical protein